jgi:hypothetical protein
MIAGIDPPALRASSPETASGNAIRDDGDGDEDSGSEDSGNEDSGNEDGDIGSGSGA